MPLVGWLAGGRGGLETARQRKMSDGRQGKGTMLGHSDARLTRASAATHARHVTRASFVHSTLGRARKAAVSCEFAFNEVEAFPLFALTSDSFY